ncbi:MAG: Phosphoglycerate mutase [Frankiales bacterium]|nr:Phosphoglycerate mutase [Frankiales bacterium]
MGDLLLVRHGETAWSAAHKHTGLTDVPLSDRGEEQARSLSGRLAGLPLVGSFVSPLQRARRTAELAGLSPEVDPDLVEWDNGRYEGRTTADIRAEVPGWWLWTDGAPDGETWEQVQPRCERVVERCLPLLEQGDVVLVGHGHTLRALAAVWLGLPASQGGLFTMEPARLSALGTYRDHRVVKLWDAP